MRLTRIWRSKTPEFKEIDCMRFDHKTALGMFCTAVLTAPFGTAQSELGKPVRIEAGGAPIDVTIGHAAPYVFDVDGDGVRDLLVGEYGKGAFNGSRLPAATLKKWGTAFDEGKLRIYRNVGTNTAPVFDGFEYMRAGGEIASIPTT